MANLQSTTIAGGITEKEGTGATAAATVALPQKGSTVVFESTNSTSFASSAYDISTNKYVIAYRDDTDGGKGKAIVGTPSGDSVVWGTPVQFSTGETTAITGGNIAENGFCMTYDPDTERIVIAWSEGDIGGTAVPSGAGKGTSKVGTVSGTGSGGTISFGSEGTFDTAGAIVADSGASQDGTRFCQCMTYDTTNNKMVLIWNKASATQPAGGQCAVGTIVGGGTNSITWGTAVDINPIGGVVTHLNFEYPAVIFDPSSENIVVEWEGTETSLGSASFMRVGTVSGTSITFGTTIIHSDGDVDDPAMSYDPVAEKIVLVYQDYSAATYYQNNAARVCTVSGSGATATCHLGYPVAFSDGIIGNSKKHDIVYNASTQRHLVHYTYYIFAAAPLYHQKLLVRSAKVTSVTLTCTTTSGSTTVTTADTSSLEVGMSVSGTGMGIGALYTEVTTITDIPNSTSFVLSTGSSAASGTPSLTFTSISFSGETTINGDGTANYGTGTDNSSPSHMQLKMAYNSADNKMLVPRPGDAGDAVGIIIDFNGTGLTVDLATGSFFEIDLETTTKDVAALTVSNPHASQVSTFILQIQQGSNARDFNWASISNVKWPGGTGPTITTTNNKIDTFSFTTYDNGTTWYGKVVGQNYSPGVNLDELFGARGVWAGGSHDSGNVTTIDYITIATPGNATAFGDLTAGHNRNIAGTSNGSRGVFGGQFGNVTTIDYITIATTGDATDFGDLTQGRSQIGATSDGARGVFAGGTTGSAPTEIVNTIDYITIATTGNATDFGDLTSTGRQGVAPASDGSRGLLAAGQAYQGAPAAIYIDYITIATTGNATDFGDMLETRRDLGGASDGSRAVFGGGFATTATHKNLEYVTISIPSNAASFGELTHSTLTQIAATSNGPRGVWGGGYVTNIMAYITIATTGNAIDFGDLTVARSGSGATSGD